MNRQVVLRPSGRAGIAAGLLVAVALSTAPASADDDTTIKLKTQQETTGATGDGRGSFTWSVDGDQLCYTLTVSDLTMAPFAAHIHLAPKKVAGPVVVGLATPPGATSSVSACITAVEGATGAGMTPAELAAIAEDPRSFYVNVHTDTFPGGEVRGQLK